MRSIYPRGPWLSPAPGVLQAPTERTPGGACPPGLPTVTRDAEFSSVHCHPLPLRGPEPPRHSGLCALVPCPRVTGRVCHRAADCPGPSQGG